ncbi:MAG: DUF3999 domain-containing protein [Deltaproteobacteria bacterium]|jgi:hypothetical protein|nr:DUF3999 domain-containing protein [Deltaproteobacteria bacterium]
MTNMIRLASLTALLTLLTCLTSAVGPAALLAQSPADLPSAIDPTGYLHWYRLQPIESGRLHRLHLENDVFSGLSASALTDITVFDGQGRPVPPLVRPVPVPVTPPVIEEKVIAVPLISLPAPEPTSPGLVSDVVITTRSGGDEFQVNLRTDGTSSAGGQRRFLVDLRAALKDTENQLILNHTLELGPISQVVPLVTADISVSSNMAGWKPLRKAWPLDWNQPSAARKRADDQRAASFSMELSGHELDSYLLIETNSASAELSWANLRVVKQTALPTPPWPSDSATFSGRQESLGSSAIIYDTKGRFPVSEAQFFLRTPGIFSSKISVKNLASDNWKHLTDLELFFIKNEKEIRQNPPLQLKADYYQYWRLNLDRPIDEPPELRLSWPPMELVFMAQGPEPFALAYGSQQPTSLVKGAGLFREALAQFKPEDIVVCQVAEAYQRPTAALPPLAPTIAPLPDDSRLGSYLVWAVLLAAAILFSVIAIKLLKKDHKTG